MSSPPPTEASTRGGEDTRKKERSGKKSTSTEGEGASPKKRDGGDTKKEKGGSKERDTAAGDEATAAKKKEKRADKESAAVPDGGGSSKSSKKRKADDAEAPASSLSPANTKADADSPKDRSKRDKASSSTADKKEKKEKEKAPAGEAGDAGKKEKRAKKESSSADLAVTVSEEGGPATPLAKKEKKISKKKTEEDTGGGVAVASAKSGSGEDKKKKERKSKTSDDPTAINKEEEKRRRKEKRAAKAVATADGGGDNAGDDDDEEGNDGTAEDADGNFMLEGGLDDDAGSFAFSEGNGDGDGDEDDINSLNHSDQSNDDDAFDLGMQRRGSFGLDEDDVSRAIRSSPIFDEEEQEEEFGSEADDDEENHRPPSKNEKGSRRHRGSITFLSEDEAEDEVDYGDDDEDEDDDEDDSPIDEEIVVDEDEDDDDDTPPPPPPPLTEEEMAAMEAAARLAEEEAFLNNDEDLNEEELRFLQEFNDDDDGESSPKRVRPLPAIAPPTARKPATLYPAAVFGQRLDKTELRRVAYQEEGNNAGATVAPTTAEKIVAGQQPSADADLPPPPPVDAHDNRDEDHTFEALSPPLRYEAHAAADPATAAVLFSLLIDPSNVSAEAQQRQQWKRSDEEEEARLNPKPTAAALADALLLQYKLMPGMEGKRKTDRELEEEKRAHRAALLKKKKDVLESKRKKRESKEKSEASASAADRNRGMIEGDEDAEEDVAAEQEPTAATKADGTTKSGRDRSKSVRKSSKTKPETTPERRGQGAESTQKDGSPSPIGGGPQQQQTSKPPLVLGGPPLVVSGFNLNDLLTEARDKYEDKLRDAKREERLIKKYYREEKQHYASLLRKGALNAYDDEAEQALDRDSSSIDNGANATDDDFAAYAQLNGLQAQMKERLDMATMTVADRHRRLRELRQRRASSYASSAALTAEEAEEQYLLLLLDDDDDADNDNNNGNGGLRGVPLDISGVRRRVDGDMDDADMMTPLNLSLGAASLSSMMDGLFPTAGGGVATKQQSYLHQSMAGRYSAVQNARHTDNGLFGRGGGVSVEQRGGSDSKKKKSDNKSKSPSPQKSKKNSSSSTKSKSKSDRHGSDKEEDVQQPANTTMMTVMTNPPTKASLSASAAALVTTKQLQNIAPSVARLVYEHLNVDVHNRYTLDAKRRKAAALILSEKEAAAEEEADATAAAVLEKEGVVGGEAKEVVDSNRTKDGEKEGAEKKKRRDRAATTTAVAAKDEKRSRSRGETMASSRRKEGSKDVKIDIDLSVSSPPAPSAQLNTKSAAPSSHPLISTVKPSYEQPIDHSFDVADANKAPAKKAAPTPSCPLSSIIPATSSAVPRASSLRSPSPSRTPSSASSIRRREKDESKLKKKRSSSSRNLLSSSSFDGRHVNKKVCELLPDFATVEDPTAANNRRNRGDRASSPLSSSSSLGDAEAQQASTAQPRVVEIEEAIVSDFRISFAPKVFTKPSVETGMSLFHEQQQHRDGSISPTLRHQNDNKYMNFDQQEDVATVESLSNYRHRATRRAPTHSGSIGLVESPRYSAAAHRSYQSLLQYIQAQYGRGGAYVPSTTAAATRGGSSGDDDEGAISDAEQKEGQGIRGGKREGVPRRRGGLQAVAAAVNMAEREQENSSSSPPITSPRLVLSGSSPTVRRLMLQPPFGLMPSQTYEYFEGPSHY